MMRRVEPAQRPLIETPPPQEAMFLSMPAIMRPTGVTPSAVVREYQIDGSIPPGLPAERRDIRIHIHDHRRLTHNYQSINRELRRWRGVGIDHRAWLDLGDQPVTDWRAFAHTWRAFLDALQEHCGQVRSIGLAATALLAPSDEPGGLSPTFVKQRTVAQGPEWSLWLGVPLAARFAGRYASEAHFVAGDRCTFWDACDWLKIRVQAELQTPTRRRGLAAGELRDLPGASYAEKLASFVGLFPQIASVRIEPDERLLGVASLLRQLAPDAERSLPARPAGNALPARFPAHRSVKQAIRE